MTAKAGEIDNSQVMHSLGQLTGAVQAMHTGLTARIDDIKKDIQRAEAAQSDRADRIEDSLTHRIVGLEDSLTKRLVGLEDGINKRVDGIEKRVSDLEKEDKRQIEKTAALGGIGGALTAAAIELAMRKFL